MKKKLIYVFLFFIVTVAFLIRFYSLGRESLWGDEYYSYAVSSSNISNIFHNIQFDYHPPLYYILLNFWQRLAGSSEISLRLLSVFFGCLIIPAIFYFTKKFVNETTGLIAALLLAFSPLAINLDREARMYPLLMLLALMSMSYFYICMICMKESGRNNYSFSSYFKGANRKNTLLFIISTTLMLYTHGLSLIVLSVQLFYLTINLKENKEYLKVWLRNILISILLFSPWIIYFLKQIRNMNKYFWVLDRDILFLGRFFIEFAGSPLLTGVFILLFCYLLLIIITQDRNHPEKAKESSQIRNIQQPYSKRNSRQIKESIQLLNESKKDFYKLILVWLVFPVLLLEFLSYVYKPFLNIKYISYSLPAFYIGSAIAIGSIKKLIPKVAISIIILTLSTIILLDNMKYQTNERWRDAALFLAANTTRGDCIVYNNFPCFTYNPLSYYLKSDSLKYYLIDKPDKPDSDNLIKQLLSRYKRLFFVKTDHDTKPEELINILRNQAEQVEVHPFPVTEKAYFFTYFDSKATKFFISESYINNKIVIYVFEKGLVQNIH